MPGFLFTYSRGFLMKKAIIFIDANNWYHNLKKWFIPSDIDISKIADLISNEKGLDILEIRWYASVPNIDDNKLIYLKHMDFLSNLKKKDIKVITRKLQRLSNKELKKKRQDMLDSWDLCGVCKPIVESSFLDIVNHSKKEKGKEVLSSFVPRGYSNELRQIFPYFLLRKEILLKCLRSYKDIKK